MPDVVFEYWVIRDPPSDDATAILNMLGADGWELVTVVFYPPDHRNFFLKRAIKQTGPPPGNRRISKKMG